MIKTDDIKKVKIVLEMKKNKATATLESIYPSDIKKVIELWELLTNHK